MPDADRLPDIRFMPTLDRRSVLRMVAPGAALSLAPAIRGAAAQPNVLFIMTDQQRFDTIAALGNSDIYTPNLDRLVKRGVTFTNAYSPCPVCVPARYAIRTGCEPPTTRIFQNAAPRLLEGQRHCPPEPAQPAGHDRHPLFHWLLPNEIFTAEGAEASQWTRRCCR